MSSCIYPTVLAYCLSNVCMTVEKQGSYFASEKILTCLISRTFGVTDSKFGGLTPSLGALVKNCNMLHNIVGPACIFLKQGFARTLVCNRKSQKAAARGDRR
uniref:Uncharacterized protein n=1 Tax=Neolamprologus brichardi TaxID=32507 RepID=A0A3Q4GB75_NEOBR